MSMRKKEKRINPRTASITQGNIRVSPWEMSMRNRFDRINSIDKFGNYVIKLFFNNIFVTYTTSGK
jgi:hypothetical protein